MKIIGVLIIVFLLTACGVSNKEEPQNIALENKILEEIFKYEFTYNDINWQPIVENIKLKYRENIFSEKKYLEILKMILEMIEYKNVIKSEKSNMFFNVNEDRINLYNLINEIQLIELEYLKRKKIISEEEYNKEINRLGYNNISEELYQEAIVKLEKKGRKYMR